MFTLPLTGVSSGNVKNGAPFPQACPKCNIHFNLLDPLKNHMKVNIFFLVTKYVTLNI